jgi:hypothetical protein
MHIAIDFDSILARYDLPAHFDVMMELVEPAPQSLVSYQRLPHLFVAQCHRSPALS